MPQKPIHEETISFRTTAFVKFPITAGIDRGLSCTKIVFIPKGTPTHAHTVQLRCLTFHNDNFADALHLMKEQAQLPNQGKLYVTGVGTDADTYRHKIKKIVGLDVDFVDEMLAICCGSYHLVNNASPNHIFYPVPDYKKFDTKVKLFDFATTKNQSNSAEDKFPAVVLHMGNDGGLMTVDKEGNAKVQTLLVLAGQCFIGMAHALLGTVDYDEIMELGEKGDPNVADLSFGDLLQGDTDSPYGIFPTGVPGLPFSRASEKSWDRSRCSREDLAASLVGYVTMSCTFPIVSIINKIGARKVYVSGNLFRSKHMRKMFYERFEMFTSAIEMDALILKTEYEGAIGAMLMNVDCKTRK